MRWRLKSSTSRLFAQTFVQTQFIENIKAPRHWPFCEGIHRWLVDSPHKWPVTRKMFTFDEIIMVYFSNSRHTTPSPLHMPSPSSLSISHGKFIEYYYIFTHNWSHVQHTSSLYLVWYMSIIYIYFIVVAHMIHMYVYSYIIILIVVTILYMHHIVKHI